MDESLSYLELAISALEGALATIEKLEDLRAIVVFGSAARPEDFVVGVSDIDVLAIAGSRPEKRRYELEILGSKAVLQIFTVEEIREVFKLGDPLAFMLYRSSRVLKDDGIFASIASRAPRATKHTSRVLRSSIFAALGLAVEAYFWSEFRRALSHACHSLRHLARYKASLRRVGAEEFPVYDREVAEALAGFSREVFARVTSLRREGSSRSDCARALDDTIRAVASELDLEAPSLSEVERVVRGTIGTAVAREVNGSIVIRVEFVTSRGFERLEIGREYAREIESVFD